MSDERHTFSYCGFSITASYNEELAEGQAWCPVCGQKRIAASADGGIQEAITAAKNQIVAHLRLSHRIRDDREQELSGIREPRLLLQTREPEHRSFQALPFNSGV